ncbi:MAG: YDG domain-containing protein [Hymenobacteraceae bacterium]|nr:YDG domain-containing protein [Hymenobacteraceae bacterium]
MLETIAGDDVALSGGTATFADKNVGTAKEVSLAGAVLAGSDKDNYALTEVASAFADITPKAASVTPIASSKVYGTADPALTGSMSDFITADGITAVYSRAAGEAVGNYAISATLSPGAALSNYNITYNIANFEITKATIKVVAASNSRVYGDANPTFTGTIEGVVSGDDIEVTYTTAATAASVVGEYDIEPSLSGEALSNYHVEKTNGVLSITKASLSAVANDKARIYGVANPVLDGVLTGVKNNDPITASYSTTADASSNVGEYPITVALNDPDGKLPNYEVSTTNGTLTISQAPATITLGELSKVYNGAAQGAEVTTTPSGLAVTVTYDGTSALPEAAGSYAVVAALDNSNYTADNATGTLVIARKEVTAALANSGKVYDGTSAAPGTTATLTGVIAEDEVTAEVANALFSSADAGTRTVTATVSLAGTDKDNYVLGKVSAANATITPKRVTAGITATDKVYDGTTAASASGSVPTADIIDGDVVEVTLSNAHFADKQVGTNKAVTATVSISNSNYELSSSTAATTATITPKELTATIAASDKVYDGNTDAIVQASVSEGLVAGDEVTVQASGARFDTKDVGTDKPVTASIAITGADAMNYLVNSTASASAAITAKQITVTADAKAKVYGDADPALTYTVAPGSLVADDEFEGSLNRVAGENVGTYAIQQNTLSAGANYTITFEAAHLTINTRAITITADAKSKTYGDADPALTAQVTSGTIVGGDQASGALSRAEGENVGAYAISQSTYTYGSNYAETFVGAALVIKPAPLTITAPSMSKYCGQADPLTGYSCSVAGAVNGEVISTSYSFNGTTVIPASRDAKLSNYTVAYINGTLTVDPVALDASNASLPRSVTESVNLQIYVRSGGADIGGVPVSLYIDGTLKGTVSSVNGIASFGLGSLAAGVYEVKAIAGGSCDEEVVYLPIYDPNGGFVTGGGWINSPKGASVKYPDATGKANFGFVAKYKKGSHQVEGNTEFQFSAGNLNFKSSSHDDMRLVISGAKASYKGRGTINGTGDYGFMLVATDGQVNGGGGVDKFRIKIWNGSNESSVVYDNQMGAGDDENPVTALGGGSIVIHEVKAVGGGAKSSKLVAEAAVQPELPEIQFYNYPNAFSDRTTIAFSLDKEESYSLEVYDVKGALVKKVSMGVAEANRLYEFEMDGRSLAEGIYIARLVTSTGAQSIKMILKK